MVQRYEQMRRLQWYKCGAAYLKIVMDSVMDFSIFEVSITLFKYLYISMLRCIIDVNRDG